MEGRRNAKGEKPGKARGARPRTQPEINEYRRRLLMEGTIRSMAENGVGGTTVRAICAGAGSSLGLIGHYYRSKEELVAAAFRYLFDSTTDYIRAVSLRDAPTALGRLRMYPSALFSPRVCTRTNLLAFLAFWHEIRFNRAVREANRKRYVDYRRTLDRMFALAAAEVGATIDTASAAVGLVALVDGLWLELAMEEGTLTRREAIRLAHDYIDHQLGLAARAR